MPSPLNFTYPVHKFFTWPRTERGRTVNHGVICNSPQVPFAPRLYVDLFSFRVPLPWRSTDDWLGNLQSFVLSTFFSADLNTPPVFLDIDAATDPTISRFESPLLDGKYRLTLEFTDETAIGPAGERMWKERYRFEVDDGATSFFLDVTTEDFQPWSASTTQDPRDIALTTGQATPYLLPPDWPTHLLSHSVARDPFAGDNYTGNLVWTTDDPLLPTQLVINDGTVPDFSVGLFTGCESVLDCPP